MAPTVTVLTVMKARLVGATKGHQLLKKKADALTMRYRQILKEIVDAKEGMGDKMKGSFFSLAEAKYAAGDNMKHTIFDNVDRATLKVFSSQDNVAGVKIPKFESSTMAGDSSMALTGAQSGGQGSARAGAVHWRRRPAAPADTPAWCSLMAVLNNICQSCAHVPTVVITHHRSFP